jgi:hypothetical protein
MKTAGRVAAAAAPINASTHAAQSGRAKSGIAMRRAVDSFVAQRDCQ